MARVLVVDDDPAVLEVLVGGLVALGHQVQAAMDGEHAREILAGGDIKVLVTDLQMPRMDGLALLAYVRDRESPIPVILVSGSWTDDQRRRARELGAARVYAKPVDLAQLARDVEEVAR